MDEKLDLILNELKDLKKGQEQFRTEVNLRFDKVEKTQQDNLTLLLDEQDRIYKRLDERLKGLSFRVIELETAE
ncbi:MAG: hypothetical protein AB1478_12640 [Nitrospirota bacterium]